MAALMQSNLEVLRWLETLRTPFLSAVFEGITLLGEEIAAIALLSFLYWCVNKNLAYAIGTAYFASGIAVQGAKMVFRVPRPWVLDAGLSPVAGEMQKVQNSYSFPSGHTQSAAAVFGTAGFFAKKSPVKTLCFLLVFFVGFSRMFVGVHTPLDVTVSWVLTLLVAFFCARYLGKGTPVRDAAVGLGLAALAAGLLILAGTLVQKGLIESRFMIDSCKQAGAALGFAAGILAERRFVGFQPQAEKGWMQAAKYLVGMAGAAGVKEGLAPLLGESAPMSAFRYFLLVFWVMAVYPWLIQKARGCAAKRG